MLAKEMMAKIRRIEIRTGRLVHDFFAGQYESVFKGRGMEFEEVRPYQPGDDIRAIDWNVTARTGHPFIKKFVEERELNIMLLVDVSPSLRFGSKLRSKADLAAELSGLLAYAAIQKQDKVGLLLFTDRVEKFIPAAKGTTHLSRMLREILTAQPQGNQTVLDPALRHLNDIIKRQSIIFIISDFHCDLSRHTLGATNRKHDVVALELADPGEEQLPNIPYWQISDLESDRSVLIPTGSPKLREAYRAAYAAWREEHRKLLRQLNIDHVELSTHTSYVEPLLSFFRQRARRFH
jgi:uncharacterized protein (DUF58 family)